MCDRSSFQRGGIYELKNKPKTESPTFFLVLTTQPNTQNIVWIASVSLLKGQRSVPGCSEGNAVATYNISPYSINTHGLAILNISEFKEIVNSNPKVTLSITPSSHIANHRYSFYEGSC